MTFLTLFLFIIGFLFLIKGGDLLVDWASSLAKKFWLSNLLIGLTIVAFWTSAPELVINIHSSFQGITGITIGNILWSNIANILLILGLAAAIYPVKIKPTFLKREIIISAMATLIFAVFINDIWIDGSNTAFVGRSEGITLIILLGFFLYYLFETSQQQTKHPKTAIQIFPLGKSFLWIGLGITGLVVGGNWIVNWAVAIATHFGISERIIGLTIIAVGTSLPELATSAIAAYKKNSDIAIANVIGSNIFNILFILGTSALIAPIPSMPGTNTDLLVLTLATLLIFFFYMRGKRKRTIEKKEGILMLLLYVCYISFLIFGK